MGQWNGVNCAPINSKICNMNVGISLIYLPASMEYRYGASCSPNQ